MTAARPIPDLFIVFMVVWFALALGSAAFSYFNHDAQLKRRVLPVLTVVAGALFIAFVVAMGIPIQGLLVIIPMIALITFLNLRALKFCDSCGRTIWSRNPFSTAKFCSSCGAVLK